MDYIEKARELGIALSETPEIQQLKEAEAEIKQEPDAYQGFIEYQEKEKNLLSSQMFGKVVSEKDSLALIDLKVRLIGKYPVIRKFFNQQQEFERIMALVNLTLTTTIFGMPSADQLPFPKEIKDMAQKILENIGGGQDSPPLDLSSLKVPDGFNLPEELSFLFKK
ncbi:hypothetical protein Sgly_2585 [Syntrophobotulus glycolicus DSM 8271]|uniref:YlbF family regulator n=1 Tax=Syntrophobotulus glycolicus (strain DSM 8271 / FlGlyR) TaxID=645991 RepID=F0SWM4_SYNGF|nr:YlbF family regulator [Syntrophobotulus glycolicus]ADY56864.1 hypothetical protein Sgly_2585 [Syntrophobotulus glycolicus DSM 8271]